MYFLSKGAGNIWLGGTIPESHEGSRGGQAQCNSGCLLVIKIDQKQENWALGLLGEGLMVAEHIN